jgi:phosphomannomutase/phosphoglucomutase
MQPSGYGFIKTAMIERQADLGVEASGHFFFKALHGGDDGLFAALLTGHILAASGIALADLIRPIGWPPITPELRIPISDAPDDVLGRIAAACGGQVTRLDGVRAEYAEGWGLARISITEPMITLRFEGRDRESLREIAAQFLAGTPELYRQVQESLE